MKAVKRIFRYLKGRPNLGLWYPKILTFIFQLILTVILVDAISIANRPLAVANFLEIDLSLGNVENR